MQQASASDRKTPRVADISKAAAVPLPETSARHQSPAPVGEGNEVVPVAAHGTRRHAESGNHEPGNVRRTLGQQRLLHGARFLGLAIEGGAFRALRLKAPRIVDRNRDVIAQCLQNPQLLAGKSVNLGMRRREHPNQAFANVQRNSHLRERRGLASDVVLVLANVGGIAQLAGGSDVSDHALAADFQAMSFALRAAFQASPHPRQHHLAVLFVVQVDAGLDAPEGIRDFIDHAVDQLVEVENRSDLMRGFLHALQVLDKIGGHSPDGRNLTAGTTGNRRHERESFN